MNWDWVTFAIGVIVGMLFGLLIPLIFAAVGSDWQDID